MRNDSTDEYYYDYAETCQYIGTDFLEIKIYLIGVFAVFIALFSLLFNSFFVIVFVLNATLRHSPLYYFGILAVMDTITAVNYLALMVVPVYMDQFESLWLYHLFLGYLRPMMTLSNCAMFASVLLIVFATVERLFKTFNSPKFDSIRQKFENHRPFVCVIGIFVAISYKLCTYFEIHYVERPNCTDWSRYEIVVTTLAANENYRFWWMFVTRNLVDRIIPFFLLVFMNFLIITTLRRETQRFAALDRNCNERTNKRNLRDATRALIAVVTLYICSQSLQVIVTFWEAFHRDSLENDFVEFYSYLNDVISIMTLLSSALRVPVYCSCNRPIFTASYTTLQRFGRLICGSSRIKSLKTVHSLATQSSGYETSLLPNGNSISELKMMRASLENADEQWMV